MSDHPVLIPTAEGPVGGIVSEPEGDRRAALILMGGYGRPARSGINAFWTRTARALADRGVVVLRFDYSREGETLPIGEGGSGQVWKRDFDLRLLEDISPWFAERIGELPLFLAGACSGGRLAIEHAGRRPREVAGAFLITPYLRALAPPGTDGSAAAGELPSLDPSIVEELRICLAHFPVWIVAGEHDDIDLPRLRELVGSSPHELVLEPVPGRALHLLDRPDVQAEAADRLIAWPLWGEAAQRSAAASST